jgi:FkbM family methyltransferase
MKSLSFFLVLSFSSYCCSYVSTQFRSRQPKRVLILQDLKAISDSGYSFSHDTLLLKEHIAFINVFRYAQEYNYDYKLINLNRTHFVETLELHESWIKIFAVYLAMLEKKEGKGSFSLKYDYVVYLDSSYFLINPKSTIFEQLRLWDSGLSDVYFLANHKPSSEKEKEDLSSHGVSMLIADSSFMVWKNTNSNRKLLNNWILSSKTHVNGNYWMNHFPYEIGAFHAFFLTSTFEKELIHIIPASSSNFFMSMEESWNQLLGDFSKQSYFQQQLFYQSMIYHLISIGREISSSSSSSSSAATTSFIDFMISNDILDDIYGNQPFDWLYLTYSFPNPNKTNEILPLSLVVHPLSRNHENIHSVCLSLFSISTCQGMLEDIYHKQIARYSAINDYFHSSYLKIYQHFTSSECGNFSPKGILDVGAAYGEWTRRVNQYFLHSSFFFIEGNVKCIEFYGNLSIPYEIAVVGNHSGSEMTFHYDATVTVNGGNSLYKENTAYASTYFIPLTVNLTTIDDIVKRRKLGSFQLLKFDIQGGEYDALLGAIETLKDVEIIQSECPSMNYNEGSSSFFELHLLMEKLGFAIFSIVDWKDVPLYPQFDVIWVKKNSTLWSHNCTHGLRNFQNSFHLQSYLEKYTIRYENYP